MKDSNFYTVQGWMVNKLHLSGNELICYAIIYGFSQDGDTLFMGSLSYLQKWMNVSRPTVINTLKSLMKKGLLNKHEEEKNKVRLCYYGINEEAKESLLGGSKDSLLGGSKESLLGGSKESLDNNIKNNKDNNKETLETSSRVRERLSHKYNKDKPLTDIEVKFYLGMEQKYPRVMHMDYPLLYRQYQELLNKGVNNNKIIANLEAMENYKPLKDRVKAYQTLLNFIKIDKNTYAPTMA